MKHKIIKLLGVGALALIVLTGCTQAPTQPHEAGCGYGSLESYCPDDISPEVTPTPTATPIWLPIEPVIGDDGSLEGHNATTLQIAEVSGSAGSCTAGRCELPNAGDK